MVFCRLRCIQTRDFRIHARTAHAVPYMPCQSTCAPHAIAIASRRRLSIPGAESSFAVKRGAFTAKLLRPNRPACAMHAGPPASPPAVLACTIHCRGPHTAPMHGQLMQSARAAEDSMRYEHVEPAHEAVRSRSLIESVRLHEHSQIHSHTTWPAQTLLFSMRKAASVLAGPSRR